MSRGGTHPTHPPKTFFCRKNIFLFVLAGKVLGVFLMLVGNPTEASTFRVVTHLEHPPKTFLPRQKLLFLVSAGYVGRMLWFGWVAWLEDLWFGEFGNWNLDVPGGRPTRNSQAKTGLKCGCMALAGEVQ